ncbi:vesicle-fusing ATPase [Nematocida sp. AWRm77]|nr:vesicle-fusing ATPase [Nematocida sp. AWRm77]
METYTVVKMQIHAWAHTNRVFISQEFRGAFCVINGFVFKAERDGSLEKGTVSLSQAQRDLVRASEGQGIRVAEIRISSRAVIAKAELSLSIKGKHGHVRVSRDAVVKGFLSIMDGVPITEKQQLYLLLSVEDEDGAEKQVLFIVGVERAETLDREVVGVVRANTEVSITEHPGISIIGAGSELKLTGDFNFQELEIGGLQSEFEKMFRRVLIQRTYPPEFIQRMGIEYVKGIMLYGPPGTGKTLIARKMSMILNSAPPKIVNGPEILNKYVGQSEENIRKLFEDAENDYKKYGDQSPLHVIIFDEIDAICKSRGSSNGVGDQVVNQLLSKIDGVVSLNNILIIGMTNRLDLIDDALLRPGRFEIHIEISLPDEKGRLEILKIHTSKMKNNCFLGADVDMPLIVSKARNYTGAEITALVKCAASFALERAKKTQEEVVIGMQDFEQALEETTPSFGVSTSLRAPEPFFRYPTARSVQVFGEQMVQRIRSREGRESKTLSLLLSGKPGTGKTTLAQLIALSSEIPFIRVISPKDLVGKEENEKVNYLKRTFKDAYKSTESLVILDDIEGLMDYVSIGPRFSNQVLQAIKVFAKNQDRFKVFVIGTTADASLLEETGILGSFDEHLPIPGMTQEDVQWFKQYTPLPCEAHQSIREVTK